MGDDGTGRKPDVVVVVPTCGDRDLIVPCLRRLLARTDGYRVQVVVVANPVDREGFLREVEPLLLATTQAAHPDPLPLVWVLDAPAGFARAVNAGLALMHRERLLPRRAVVLLNDDALVADGWLEGLFHALRPDAVVLRGEAPGEDGHPRVHPPTDWGRIGLAGPVTNLAAGPQQRVRLPPGQGDPDQVARSVRLQPRAGIPESAGYLSGFCLALARPCYDDLLRWVPDGDASRPVLLEEEYGIGGYEDDDLLARAHALGWRPVVATGSFVLHLGHRTLDRAFPGQARGLANAPLHLARYAQAEGQRLAVAGLVRLRGPQDLAYWRAHLRALAPYVDALCYVLDGSPDQISGDLATLRPEDRALVDACAGATGPEVGTIVERWLETCVIGIAPVSVQAILWDGEPDERAMRNAAIAEAERRAPWVFACDHDEAPEGRDLGPLLDRCLRHPDPLVQGYDVGILHLWDTPRCQRVDPPWGDGGTYAGGDHAVRLWRHTPRPLRVHDGHGAAHQGCAAAPALPPEAVRACGIRLLSYRLLRAQDREQYAGGLPWILHEEGMRLSPVVRACGIGFTLLAYPGEAPHDLARWLGIASPLVDRIAVVWTDPGEIPDAHAAVLAVHGAEVVRCDLGAVRSYAEARNAGLDALRQAGCAWAWVADPDEHWSDGLALGVAVRRMAECSDTYGWTFRFANPRADGGAGGSETIRLVRLDPDGLMRYANRVHETFDSSLRVLAATGVHPQIRTAPFLLQNLGLASRDPIAAEGKLLRYAWLLAEELADRPGNSAAWTCLGLQYESVGRADDARTCYERAARCAGTGHLGWKELAAWHLRRAREATDEALARVAPNHPLHGLLEGHLGWLDEQAPPVVRLGLAAAGEAQPEAYPPLPDWPTPDPEPVV